MAYITMTTLDLFLRVNYNPFVIKRFTNGFKRTRNPAPTAEHF